MASMFKSDSGRCNREHVVSHPTPDGVFFVCSECVHGFNANKTCEHGGVLATRSKYGCYEGRLHCDLEALFRSNHGKGSAQ